MTSKTISVVDTGGTFNKYYDPVAGQLLVDTDGKALDAIAREGRMDFVRTQMIGKDSLEMTGQDRLELLAFLHRSETTKHIVVHGTDTMELTARYLEESELKEKQIVLTGAMVPWSIDPQEAVANFTLAYAFCRFSDATGIYIAMHGHVAPASKITKDKQAGEFVLRR